MTQDAPRSTNWLPLLISTAVSIGAIFLIFRNVDMAEFTSQLQNADVRYIPPLLMIYVVAVFLRAYRWQKLLEVPMPYWRGFHIVNIGYLFNTVLPFRAGEFARVLLVSREPNQNAGSGLSAVAIERLFDLMMALSCLGLGLVFVSDTKSLPQDTASALGFFILLTIVGIIIFLFVPPLYPRLLALLNWLSKPLPDAIGEPLRHFAEDTLNNLQAIATPRRLASLLLWSILTWVGYVGFFYVGLFSFFDDVPPLGVGLLVTGFVALGIAAPSLPGAIGVFQAAAILALDTARYDTDIATSYAWALWIVQTLLIIGVGVWGLSALSLSFGGLAQDVRRNRDHLEAEHDHDDNSANPSTD